MQTQFKSMRAGHRRHDVGGCHSYGIAEHLTKRREQISSRSKCPRLCCLLCARQSQDLVSSPSSPSPHTRFHIARPGQSVRLEVAISLPHLSSPNDQARQKRRSIQNSVRASFAIAAARNFRLLVTQPCAPFRLHSVRLLHF